MNLLFLPLTPMMSASFSQLRVGLASSVATMLTMNLVSRAFRVTPLMVRALAAPAWRSAAAPTGELFSGERGILT
jgi:hypothetical protein